MIGSDGVAKTIAAVATGNSAGGIGVIRISGDCAIEIVTPTSSISCSRCSTTDD